MAAGFGGLLGTPIAATCFALEVIVAGEMKYQALFPALIAAISAMEVTQAFGMTKFTFPLNTPMYFTIPFILQLLLLGVIFGLVGAIFAWLIRQAKHFFKVRIPSPIVRIMGGGAVLSVLFLLLHTGRYSGMGLDLIDYSLKGGVIYSYDWILKLLLTVLTLSLGFQGGELVPLFSIGASLGAVLGNLLGLPVPLVAALGYAAVFGSATNTLFAPVLLGGEIFGFSYTPAFFIVCAVAYIFNMNQTIYGKQIPIRERIRRGLRSDTAAPDRAQDRSAV
jgi:H+/Cl- antiporter ClcA